MKKFEVGKQYEMRSPCDHNCIWRFTVAARTAQTITLQDDKGKTTKHRINAKTSGFLGCEAVFPLGRFSMAPTLKAR